MSLVLDASVAIAWCFDDERTPHTEALLDAVIASGAVVPPLWKTEVANGLLVAMRRRRIDARYRDDALAQIADLTIEIDAETLVHSWGATLSLAGAHGLTAYDATYLELAIRRSLPLATLDAALARAAREAGVAVAGDDV